MMWHDAKPRKDEQVIEVAVRFDQDDSVCGRNHLRKFFRSISSNVRTPDDDDILD